MERERGESNENSRRRKTLVMLRSARPLASVNNTTIFTVIGAIERQLV